MSWIGRLFRRATRPEPSSFRPAPVATSAPVPDWETLVSRFGTPSEDDFFRQLYRQSGGRFWNVCPDLHDDAADNLVEDYPGAGLLLTFHIWREPDQGRPDGGLIDILASLRPAARFGASRNVAWDGDLPTGVRRGMTPQEALDRFGPTANGAEGVEDWPVPDTNMRWRLGDRTGPGPRVLGLSLFFEAGVLIAVGYGEYDDFG